MHDVMYDVIINSLFPLVLNLFCKKAVASVCVKLCKYEGMRVCIDLIASFGLREQVSVHICGCDLCVCVCV